MSFVAGARKIVEGKFVLLLSASITFPRSQRGTVEAFQGWATPIKPHSGSDTRLDRFSASKLLNYAYFISLRKYNFHHLMFVCLSDIQFRANEIWVENFSLPTAPTFPSDFFWARILIWFMNSFLPQMMYLCSWNQSFSPSAADSFLLRR